VTITVWDTSPLWHAGLADRLDVLGDCAKGPEAARWRNVTTATVVSELERNGLTPGLGWLEIVHVDELDELLATMKWTTHMGVNASQGANLGEATVCAWAEVHGGTAIIDEKDAREVAPQRTCRPRQPVGSSRGGANRSNSTFDGGVLRRRADWHGRALPVRAWRLRGMGRQERAAVSDVSRAPGRDGSSRGRGCGTPARCDWG